MTGKDLPLIKEYRIDMIEKCLECIDRYAYNRDKQKICVLDLYPNKKNRSMEDRDKSVFRGMVILSLRQLGLILGYENAIRLSANGKLLVESKSIDQLLHNRVRRAIIYEIDETVFGFIDTIKSKNLSLFEDFCKVLFEKIDAPSEKQKRERISHWVSILKQVELIDYSSKQISVNNRNLNQTLNDINAKNLLLFEKYFFETYFQLGRDSAGVVDIADLRERVSVRMLRECNVILTEKRFDNMLRNILSGTHKYLVSLGKPMGAREKLFEYKGGYFRTILIKAQRV